MIEQAMKIALACSHGRWVGETQFAACVSCIAAALEAQAAQTRALRDRVESLYAFVHGEWLQCRVNGFPPSSDALRRIDHELSAALTGARGEK